MGSDPRLRWQYFRRYGPIGAVIAIYFGFHTLAQTALAVASGGGTVTAVCLAVYMGIGLLIDSPASAIAHRNGLRGVVMCAGLAVIVSSSVGASGVSLGWWVVLLAAVLAGCSSLIYVPALAHYSALLGNSQAMGQRFAVLMQRGGALVASGAIAAALGAGRPVIMWWAMIAAGCLLTAAGGILPARRSSNTDGARPGLRAVAVAVRAARSSRRLVRGIVVAASMPLVFVLTGSVLVLALPDEGGAVGSGLLVREAAALVAAILIGRGTLARANREFAMSCLLAVVGVATMIAFPFPATVVLGIMATGPVIASAIVASAWNTSRAAPSSAHPWACFAAMGMAARASGLLSPFVLSAGLGMSNAALVIVFAVAMLGLAWGAVAGEEHPRRRY